MEDKKRAKRLPMKKAKDSVKWEKWGKTKEEGKEEERKIRVRWVILLLPHRIKRHNY